MDDKKLQWWRLFWYMYRLLTNLERESRRASRLADLQGAALDALGRPSIKRPAYIPTIDVSGIEPYKFEIKSEATAARSSAARSVAEIALEPAGNVCPGCGHSERLGTQCQVCAHVCGLPGAEVQQGEGGDSGSAN